MPRTTPYLLGFAVIGLSFSTATPAVERYEGVAYAPDDASLLYRETHYLYRDGDVEKRLVLYRCGDGTAFARKSLTEFPSASAPDVDFFDARLGYREGVSSNKEHRFAYYQRREDASLKQKELQLNADDVVDAGFDAYVRAHWNSISPRMPLHAAIVVPGKLTTVPVTITEANDGDPEVRHLLMRLDSWLRLVVQPISLEYQRSNRRLLAFRGIGTIRDASGRNLNVHIRFPPDQRTSIGFEDVITALHLPLSGKCSQ